MTPARPVRGRSPWWPAAAPVAALALLPGCASVTTGTTQPVAVEAAAGATPVAGAQCQLSNDKGAWSLISPGVVQVRASYQDLVVRCESDAYQPGVMLVKSSTKGMAFGNVLVGGLIGASVDVASGAAYQYPSSVVVALGAPTGPSRGPAEPPRGPAEPEPAWVPRAGDAWQFEVEDRFTGLRRSVLWTLDRIEADRLVFDGGQRVEDRRDGSVTVASPRAGDLEIFEPPRGWGRPRLDVGLSWQERYQANDGLPRSPVELSAQVLRHERVDTPAGRFTTAVVQYEGMALRESSTAFIPHPARFTVWIDLSSRRVVRFESEIRASLSSRPVRVSRERAELVRRLLAAQGG